MPPAQSRRRAAELPRWRAIRAKLSVMLEVGPYIPSLERARRELESYGVEVLGHAVDLLALDPDETHPLAAVVVAGQALRRTSWTKVEELTLGVFERIRKQETTGSSGGYEERLYTLLDPAMTPREQRCSACALIGEGKTWCSLCLGTGCESCEDTGRATCATCSGSGRTMLAAVHYVTETPLVVRDVLCPSMPAEFRHEVKSALGRLPELPDCLSTDLESGSRGSAYRAHVEPSFEGFRFGDAARLAKKLTSRINDLPLVVRCETRFYAWPLLCTAYHVDEAVVDALWYVSPEGGLRAKVDLRD